MDGSVLKMSLFRVCVKSFLLSQGLGTTSFRPCEWMSRREWFFVIVVVVVVVVPKCVFLLKVCFLRALCRDALKGVPERLRSALRGVPGAP